MWPWKNKKPAAPEQRHGGFFSTEGLHMLDNQAQRDGLNAPGAQAATHLVPQERGDLVTHQAIEHTAGLLRVNEVLVDIAGVPIPHPDLRSRHPHLQRGRT